MFMNVLLQGVWDLHCLVRPISQDQCIESLHFNFRSLCAVQPTLIDGSNRKYSWKGCYNCVCGFTSEYGSPQKKTYSNLQTTSHLSLLPAHLLYLVVPCPRVTEAKDTNPRRQKGCYVRIFKARRTRQAGREINKAKPIRCQQRASRKSCDSR